MPACVWRSIEGDMKCICSTDLQYNIESSHSVDASIQTQRINRNEDQRSVDCILPHLLPYAAKVIVSAHLSVFIHDCILEYLIICI